MRGAMGQPPRRAVAVECLTAVGWVSGRFHVPAQQSFIDFLQQGGAFLPLTDAILPGRPAPLPFFAVHRAGLALIAPDPADALLETLGAQGITSPWSVTCAFPGGLLEGQIDFLTNQRLSDYLRVPQHFILVREARWEPLLTDDARRHATRRDLPIAVVQLAELVGIAEAETQRGRGHPGKLQPESELGMV
ncbi:MAG: hypothetical protein H0T68_10950 [Gemmatimonadales bacterium]|nr:hypothetical protein [Gemmatimonadales bacterium]